MPATTNRAIRQNGGDDPCNTAERWYSLSIAGLVDSAIGILRRHNNRDNDSYSEVGGLDWGCDNDRNSEIRVKQTATTTVTARTPTYGRNNRLRRLGARSEWTSARFHHPFNVTPLLCHIEGVRRPPRFSCPREFLHSAEFSLPRFFRHRGDQIWSARHLPGVCLVKSRRPMYYTQYA